MQKPYEIPMNKMEIYATMQLRYRSFDDFTKYPIGAGEGFIDYINGTRYLVIALPEDNTDSISYQFISKRGRKPKSILS